VDPTFDSLDRFLVAPAGDGIYFDADVARDELERRGQFNIETWLDALSVRPLWDRVRESTSP